MVKYNSRRSHCTKCLSALHRRKEDVKNEKKESQKKEKEKEREKESQVPKNRTRNPRSLVNINVEPLP